MAPTRVHPGRTLVVCLSLREEAHGTDVPINPQTQDTLSAVATAGEQWRRQEEEKEIN